MSGGDTLSTCAVTWRLSARFPLVNVTCTLPLLSDTACAGAICSSAIRAMEKLTVIPESGSPTASVTWKVSTDCSGKPEPRTPMVAGCAPIKCIAPG